MSNGGGARGGLSVDTTLVDLETAWKERIADAALLATTSPAMSLAMRVYALEIGLKVLVCRRLGLTSLPNHCRTHDLNEVIIFSGLHPELIDPANSALRQNWEPIVRFSKERLNNLRYAPNAAIDPADVSKLTAALDDPTEGVWTWLSGRL